MVGLWHRSVDEAMMDWVYAQLDQIQLLLLGYYLVQVRLEQRVLLGDLCADAALDRRLDFCFGARHDAAE